MPSFFVLLLMSLTLTAPQTRDDFRSPRLARAGATSAMIANQSVAAIQTAPSKVALSASATAPAVAPTVTAPPAVAILEAAAKDLLVRSEIDAPIAVKFWPSERSEFGPQDVAGIASQSAAARLEIVTVAAFFNNAVLIEDWMSDDEKAMARKFQNFVGVLQAQLENPQVYLFGERERTVVIIGKVKGGFGGAVTLVVET